jgi:hypothetical protein
MLVFSNMQAQVKFGPKAGLNLSTMKLSYMGVSIDPTMLVGFHAGLLSEITLSGNLCLQPAILYSTKGSKFSVMSEELQISPSFIEIPVNIVYKFDLGSVKLFLNVGPYGAYGIGGKADSGGESEDIVFGSEETDDMKPMDFGLNVGAGVEISNIIISANYGLGLANLAPVTTEDEEMKTKVIGFSIAYLFGGK